MGKIPIEIETKFQKLQKEVDAILEAAFANIKTELVGKISFEYVSSTPRNILTDFERAQSICFITRYEALPTVDKIDVLETNGKYHLGNYTFIRHVLNEYRPIISNQKDSVYFGHIHKFCRQKLQNRDESRDLSITVHHIEDGGVTGIFTRTLDEKYKAIRELLKLCEFDYIYNGILQHSDHRFTRKFLKEYVSGDINYVFIKHAQLLGSIKDLLYWHYRLMRELTFPKLGPL